MPIITTKHEADNRVDSTVSVNQKVGYIKIYRETARGMHRPDTLMIIKWLVQKGNQQSTNTITIAMDI